MSDLYRDIAKYGLDANKPTAKLGLASDLPNTFQFYYATDTDILYKWNGTAWTAAGDNGMPVAISAAGATQGNATAITSRKAIVTTATASSKGVKLPAAATGLEVVVANVGPTFGVKVYPASGDKINALATNAVDTTVLAALKSTRYMAIDAVKWVTLRGA